MQIGSASESITVEEGAPLIQAETATVEQIIDRNIIAELPTLTRNPYDFVGLSAGTVPSLNHGQDASHPGVGVNYAINGQRPESANFLLDGSDNVNPDTSTPAQTVPNDAIREYRVMTNGFSAEYGRNAGFVANLVTKGGTNEVHGSAYDYWRNSLLAGNSFENNSRGFPRAVFNRHQPGATLGGPIVRDRAFFFGSFESTVVRSSDSRTFFVPSPELLSNSAPATQAIFRKYPVSGKPTGAPPVMRSIKPFGGAVALTIPAFNEVALAGPVGAGAGSPQDLFLGTLRLDYALTTRNSLTASWTYHNRDDFSTLRQPYGADLVTDDHIAKQTGNITLTRVWSPRLVTESRAALKRLAAYHDEAGPYGYLSALRINGEVAALPTGTSKQGNWLDSIQLYQNANWVTRTHSLKFGGSVFPQRENADVVGTGISVTFSNVQGFVNGIAGSVLAQLDFFANHVAAGDVVRGPLTPPNLRHHVRFTDQGWYLQDTWKATRRLTLTPGIRWDYFGVGHSPGQENALNVNFYPGPGATFFDRFASGGVYPITEAPGNYRGHNLMPDRNNWAPRMGIAYDLTGDGKTVLRAGGGIFYDEWFGGRVAGFNGFVTFTNVNLTPEMVSNPYNVTGSASTRPQFGTLDPDRRTPYSATWNASLQREVRGVVVLSVAYVGSSGVSLYEESRYNAPNSGRYIGRPDQALQPKFDWIAIVQNLGHSSFQGLQGKVESRPLRNSGLQFGGNYSWGHSIDNVSSYSGETIGFAQGFLTDALRPRLDRGDSSFDQRHRFVAYFIWKIPSLRAGPTALRHLADGWQTSGILAFQTGQPFLVEDLGITGRAPVSTRPRVTGILPQVVAPEQRLADPVTPNRFLYLPTNRTRNGTA
jgi:hypothetical protein